MKVGLTYDLRSAYLAAGYSEEETAEFDRADTIDALEAALCELGHETDRIGHAQQLIERLAAGDGWDLVFNICEGLHGLAREAQVPAILDVYGIAYTFSDPLVMALSLHKGLTKTVLSAAGVPTPRFVVLDQESVVRGQGSGVRSQESGVRGQKSEASEHESYVEKGRRDTETRRHGDAETRRHEEVPASPRPRVSADSCLLTPDSSPLRFPLFIKPVAEGTGKGIDATSIVHDLESLRRGCERLWKKFGQPVLVEEFLPGREFTVGLIGTGNRAEVLGTLEVVLRETAEPNVYSYTNKEQSEERVDYPLVSGKTDATVRQAEDIALRAWQALGARDAGRVDLRCDADGRPQFIEVNPLAGLHPWHSDLPMLCTAVGISYVELVRRIVDSAAERARPPVEVAHAHRRRA